MQFRYVAAVLAIGLSLAGCQRTSVGGFGGSPQAALPPLQAQPVGGVQSGALPPPPTSEPGQFPAPPETAALSVPAGEPPASALDITKESMVGNWRVSNSGVTCDMFLTLTNLGSGSRGGTRGCAGPLTAMGSWEVSGRQVLLKDRSGNVIGRVYKSADARFDGSLSTGQPISLSR